MIVFSHRSVGADRYSSRSPRLSLVDVWRVGASGLHARPLRVTLAALGIAIGIGALVAMVGISSSGRAQLDARLDRLGTNLLTVSPGSTLFGERASLPMEAVPMVRRIAPVESATATGKVNANVYRNDHISLARTSSLAVLAAQLDLLPTVGGHVSTGKWLNPATAAYPGVVLGASAAERLGVDRPGSRVWLKGRWFSVVGTLNAVALAPELDSAAMVGWPAAEAYLGFDGHPTTVYARSTPARVEDVRSVLAATANPENPYEVKISRPSDALTAQRETQAAFSGMLLGLGLVALVVGGVGVANIMIISVLERRSEIGLRRALGATRGQIRVQFLAESLLLSILGGVGGALLGVAATAAYSGYQHWPVVVPPWVTFGGVLATVPIGIVAGIYPAVRAARLAPATALSTA